MRVVKADGPSKLMKIHTYSIIVDAAGKPAKLIKPEALETYLRNIEKEWDANPSQKVHVEVWSHRALEVNDEDAVAQSGLRIQAEQALDALSAHNKDHLTYEFRWDESAPKTISKAGKAARKALLKVDWDNYEYWAGLFERANEGIAKLSDSKDSKKIIKEFNKYMLMLYPPEEDFLQKCKDQIDSISGDLDKVKGVASKINKRAGEIVGRAKGIADSTGKFLDNIIKIKNIINSNDPPSLLSDKHPAVDGLISILEIGAEWADKVPVLGELITFFVGMVTPLSKVAANLNKAKVEKFLSVMAIKGETK